MVISMVKITLETGEEKIQKICNVLRRETLEPAQEDAKKIIKDAQHRAEQIILEAKKQAEEIIAAGYQTIEQERNVFQSSLLQASKQSIEALKQSIEKDLFNPELHEQLSRQTTDPKIIANLIAAIVQALDKQGLAADLSAIIPASVSPKAVNQLLAEDILNKLKDKSVILGDFSGGAKVRVDNKKMTLDISEKEIEELVRRYVRKDFRKLMFGE